MHGMIKTKEPRVMSKNEQQRKSMVYIFEFNGFVLLIRCESIHLEMKEPKNFIDL